MTDGKHSTMFTLDFDPVQQHKSADDLSAAASEERFLHQSRRPSLPPGALGQEFTHKAARISQLLEMIHDDTGVKYDGMVSLGRTFGAQVDAHVDQDRSNAGEYRTEEIR